MTKEQVILKTREVIGRINYDMCCQIEKALNSGTIDLDAYEDNYKLPKIITYALLKDELHELCMTGEMIEEAENLYNCL